MRKSTTLHANWEFIQTRLENKKLGYSQTEWLPAQVPGHIHLDLIQNGIISDPHLKLNEIGVQWVDQEAWSYRTTFFWTAKDGAPRRVLRFEGLDTVCRISLNGEEIARHDNMFVPLEVDVSDRLTEGENTLRVDFESALLVGEARRNAYFAAEGIFDGVDRFDERAFVRKAQFMYGWDWGPRLVSCGIWQPVQLIEFAHRILDVQTYSTLDEDGGVEVNLSSSLDLHGEPDYEVLHEISGLEELVGEGVTVLDEVALWSPNAPNTNIVHSYLLVDGVLADSRETRTGFAKTELRREPDAFGESFEFVINGKRIWARGANWIPDHSFPAAVTETRYREQLERAKDMGINMLRVWGGGLYELDVFHDLCDELGILVWQDFPFACSYYPDGDEMQAVVAEEARVNILRIRNHPCLALWCGNNENSEMWENGWSPKERTPNRYYGEHLYNTSLANAVAEFDPGRSYIPTSPIGEPPSREVVDAKRRGPNSDHYGDQHNWDVWHGRGDWRFYSDSKGRFSSEYGFAASPSLALWHQTYGEPAGGQDYKGVVARWHDKTGKGCATYVGYVELHYPVSKDLADWVYYSQLNQRDALRHGIEHYRRSEFCRGSLIWQMNDCWPVQSWAFVDSSGEKKALGYELSRLHDDLLVSIVRENDEVTAWLILDNEDQPDEEAASAIVEDLEILVVSLQTGEVLRSARFEEVEIESGERRAAGNLSIAGLPTPDLLVVARFGPFASARLVAEPKLARFAEPSPVVASLARDGSIQLQFTHPAVDVMLTAHDSAKPFDDNFFTVPHPGSVKIALNAAIDPASVKVRSLSGFHRVEWTRSPLF